MVSVAEMAKAATADAPTSALEAVEHPLIYSLIFFAYIIAALYLAIRITIRLISSYHAVSTTHHGLAVNRLVEANTGKLRAMSFIAFLSFAALSFNMLSFLAGSFTNWASLRGIDLPFSSWSDVDLGQLWAARYKLFLISDADVSYVFSLLYAWLRESTLFLDFAREISGSEEGWWWSVAALSWSMGWCVFMTVEGTRRGVAGLGEFFALSQVLPISFTQNLFLVGLVIQSFEPVEKGKEKEREGLRGTGRVEELEEEDDDENGDTTGRTSETKASVKITRSTLFPPAPLLQSIPPTLFFLTLLLRSHWNANPTLLLSALLFIRLQLLLIPYFILRPRTKANTLSRDQSQSQSQSQARLHALGPPLPPYDRYFDSKSIDTATPWSSYYLAWSALSVGSTVLLARQTYLVANANDARLGLGLLGALLGASGNAVRTVGADLVMAVVGLVVCFW